MSIEKAKKYLEEKGFLDRVIEPDVSTATVELAAAAIGVEPGRICKSLSFLIDASGKKIGVLLSWPLWKRVEPLVQSVLESVAESEDFAEPVAAFDAVSPLS